MLKAIDFVPMANIQEGLDLPAETADINVPD